MDLDSEGVAAAAGSGSSSRAVLAAAQSSAQVVLGLAEMAAWMPRFPLQEEVGGWG